MPSLCGSTEGVPSDDEGMPPPLCDNSETRVVMVESQHCHPMWTLQMTNLLHHCQIVSGILSWNWRCPVTLISHANVTSGAMRSSHLGYYKRCGQTCKLFPMLTASDCSSTRCACRCWMDKASCCVLVIIRLPTFHQVNVFNGNVVSASLLLARHVLHCVAHHDFLLQCKQTANCCWHDCASPAL